MNKIFFTAIIAIAFSTNIAFGENIVLLQPEQMQKDAKVLKEALTTLHPGLYRYNTKAQIENSFAEVDSKVQKPLDEKQFYLLISQLVEKIKCGHTFMNPLNLNDNVAERIFSNQVLPFYFVLIDGKIIVTHNISENTSIQRGDVITEINGVRAAKIIDKLLTVSRGDGNNSLGKRLNNINLLPEEVYGHALFDIYFPLLFQKNSDQFTVAVTKFNGKRSKFKVSAITPEQKKSAYEKQFGKIPQAEETWEYKSLSEQTAYMKFGTFAFWNSDFQWKSYLETAFINLNSKPSVKNLIIDLRGNEGGNGEIRDEILSYITPKPTRGEFNSTNCYRSLKINDSLLPYLSTWDKRFKQPKNSDDFFMNEIGLYERKIGNSTAMVTPKPNRFKGNVYLLTDPVNSSSTFDMAWTFQENKLGKIIGEKTGGTKQGLNGGEMFFLTLPDTKFEIDLPILYYYVKNVPDEGVTPDYIVKTTLENVRNSVDSQLDFTMNLIAKNGEAE